MSEEPLVVSAAPPRFDVESATPVTFDVIADDGDVDVDIRTPVALTLPEIDTKGPPPPDCRLPLPLLRLIPSPSAFLC